MSWYPQRRFPSSELMKGSSLFLLTAQIVLLIAVWIALAYVVFLTTLMLLESLDLSSLPPSSIPGRAIYNFLRGNTILFLPIFFTIGTSLALLVHRLYTTPYPLLLLEFAATSSLFPIVYIFMLMFLSILSGPGIVEGQNNFAQIIPYILLALLLLLGQFWVQGSGVLGGHHKDDN